MNKVARIFTAFTIFISTLIGGGQLFIPKVFASAGTVITSPTAGQIVGAGDLTITGSANNNWQVGVKIDGVSVGVADSDGTGRWSLLVHGVAAGSHVITAQMQTKHHYGFLANVEMGTIDVVDVEFHSYVHEIVDEFSVGTTYNARDDNIYSAATWTNRCAMRIINTNTYTKLDSFGVGPDGSRPISITLDKSGNNAYLLCNDTTLGTYYVVVFDTINKVPTDVFSVDLSIGTYPSGITVSPDNTKIWIRTNYGVEIFNVSDHTKTNTIGLNEGGTAQQNIVFSADGSKAYTGEFSDGLVYIINTSNYSFASLSVGAGVKNLAFTPDFSKLYAIASYITTRIIVINPADNTIIDDQPTSAPPESLAITDDGINFLVGDDHGTGGIFFGAVAGNAVVENTIFAPNGGGFFTFTGNFITAAKVLSDSDVFSASFTALAAPNTGLGGGVECVGLDFPSDSRTIPNNHIYTSLLAHSLK